MKIAIVYHGISFGINFKNNGEPVNYLNGIESIKKHLIRKNPDCNFDIYFHSWSNQKEKEIIEELNPIDFRFEKNKTFVKPTFIRRIKAKIKSLVYKVEEANRINNIISRWYSAYKGIEILNYWSRENNVSYDFIFLLRFDMVVLSPIILKDLIEKNHFITGRWTSYKSNKGFIVPDNKLIEELKNKGEKLTKFQRGYPHDNEGLQDFIFGANQPALTDFCNLYMEISQYVTKYGASNHKIALGRYQEIRSKHNLELKKSFEYVHDYYLDRWL